MGPQIIGRDAAGWNATRPPLLAEGEVHLWRASLSVAPGLQAALFSALSPDEEERASRFRCPHLQTRFRAARGILRNILARYLVCRPEDVSLGCRPGGKPVLLPDTAGTLRFNLSHSKAMALFGITTGREIGVDLEQIRSGCDHQAIADRFFSPKENAALLALPPPLRKGFFFRLWTCKEAYVKARGEGLRIPLASFEVLIPPDGTPVLGTPGSPTGAPQWSLVEVRPAPGYVGALAVAGTGRSVAYFDWEASAPL